MESKYHTIYGKLLTMIEEQKVKAGDLLPSENELMKIHDASRDTIRKALNLLAQNGYISKAKGKGSVVLDNSRFSFPVSGVTSFKELAQSMGGVIETIVSVFESVDADKDLKWELMMEEGKVWKIERIRKFDGERIIRDIDHLNAQIIPGLTKEIAQDSLYDYIEHTLGLKISFAKKEITVQNATQKDKELLDMKQYEMVVSVKSFTYLEDATLFQYTESRHRPDKFQFIDFARRDS
ncbi:trehalose operon repressor [Amedibacillus sp. YH-ame10]